MPTTPRPSSRSLSRGSFESVPRENFLALLIGPATLRLMPANTAHSQSAILERVVRPARTGMTRAAARSLLQLKFSPADQRRMSRLLAAAQADKLTPAQAAELENYRNVGRMVDLVQSQARQSLAQR